MNVHACLEPAINLERMAPGPAGDVVVGKWGGACPCLYEHMDPSDLERSRGKA